MKAVTLSAAKGLGRLSSRTTEMLRCAQHDSTGNVLCENELGSSRESKTLTALPLAELLQSQQRAIAEFQRLEGEKAGRDIGCRLPPTDVCLLVKWSEKQNI